MSDPPWLSGASQKWTSLLEEKSVTLVYYRTVSLANLCPLQHIKAGEGLIASNQSANRDEEVFPDPDKFDMHRKRAPEQALGFGYGEHQCVAEWLARAEMEIVFGEFCVDCSCGTLLIDVSSYDFPETAEFEVGCSFRGDSVDSGE
jgi:hypothetical protein